MIIASVFLGVYLLFLLQQYIYRHYWDKNLTVQLSLSDETVVEGDELILYETVTNKKLLPLPMLNVKFMTSKYFLFLDTNNSTVTDNYYRNDLLYCMMYQKLTRSLSFLCTHRGYYTITNMDVVCSDMFYTLEAVEKIDTNIQLYVYPKQLDNSKFQIPFQKMLGTVLTKRFINEDPFEFRSVREYQTYDTMKSINWKASAKTDSLKVNVYDYTSTQQVKILLNLESETMWKYEDILEESIRLTATFASAFIDQGIPVSIYTNGRDVVTKEILHVSAGSGNNHMQIINEILSRIDTMQEIPAFVPLYQDHFTNNSPSEYMIVISSYQREDLQLLLSSLIHSKVDFSWIIPLNKDIALTAKEELLHNIIPWDLQ